MRGSLPNKYCDPKIAADLFHECLDEHLLCDELGVNIVSIEHHAGINSLYGASPMILGIIARQTSKVRILSQGTLITVRRDPVRVAEEYAIADVISRGRLEIGFVKSGDSEMVSGNANPVGIVERFWEAIDLIVKTLTSHEGPFSWEGKHFTHRHMNIWPPSYQRPHPPIWAATGDPETSRELGRRGMVNALVLRGMEATKRALDAYREARAEAGLPAPGPDRFAYAAFVYVGDTDEEGVRVGSKLLWFLNTSLKQAPQMSKFLPGRTPPELAPQTLRAGARAGARPAEPGRHDRGAGDRKRHDVRRQARTVYRQIMECYNELGGFGHLIFIGRSGFLTHAEAEKSITVVCDRGIAAVAGDCTGGGGMIANVLTIAGSDPSGGAGIQADLKSFSALGVYGMSVITALTAQNTRGVRSFQVVDPDFVAEQIDAIFDDVRVDAVKIGMVATADVAAVVADRLRKRAARNVVLDPVMVAKSGDRLLQDDAVAAIRDQLVPLA